MATVCQLLEEVAGKFGPKTALVIKRSYRPERWSYQELRDFSERAASHLLGLGLARGDRLLIWAPNMPEWVGLYFGCLRAGVVAVPLDMRSAPDFVARVKEKADARGLFVSRAMEGQAPDLGVPTWHLEDLPQELEGLSPDCLLPPPVEEDTAALMFTSGTTGDPKGVILTHRNIASNVLAATRVLPSRPTYRLLSLLPLSHMLEQTVGLLAPLTGGAAIVYPATRVPAALFRLLQEERITSMVVVPQAMHLFWNAIEREVVKQGKERAWRRLLRLSSHLPMGLRRALFRPVHRQLGGHLQFFLCGGAYLDPELARRWELLGIAVVEGYGTTEAAPIVTCNSLKARRLGTVGKVLPGQEVRIASDGEVLTRGPNVTQGYWRNPEATARAFDGDWLKTGDLGRMEADGSLRLLGRKEEMIVLESGLNVHPQDVEGVLNAHPSLKEACVLGLPGHGGRVQVHAVLLLKDAEENPKAAVEQANRQLAEHQRVQGFTVWPFADFPRTHTMKVKRREVLDYLVKGAPPGRAEPALAQREAAGVPPLHRLLAAVADVPVESIATTATLEEVGLDSLGRVELLSAAEAELGVYLDESQVSATTTVQELEALVARAREAARKPTHPRWPLHPLVGVGRSTLQSLVLFPALRLLMPQKTEGREHLKGLQGPVLFAANHLSQVDTAAVLRALPARWRGRTAVAAAAVILSERGRLAAGAVALLFNAFPFAQTEAVRPTLEHCGWLLDKGWSILIFPEGTRSRDGRMGPFKAGAGLMAVALRVPVVPVHIQGTYKVLPRGQLVPRPGRVRVRFGPPLRFSPATSYGDATQAIEAAVKALEEPAQS